MEKEIDILKYEGKNECQQCIQSDQNVKDNTLVACTHLPEPIMSDWSSLPITGIRLHAGKEVKFNIEYSWVCLILTNGECNAYNKYRRSTAALNRYILIRDEILEQSRKQLANAE